MPVKVPRAAHGRRSKLEAPPEMEQHLIEGDTAREARGRGRSAGLGEEMSKTWTRDEILELLRGFQPASVLAAAADLDLFRVLAEGPMTAGTMAHRLASDLRATTVLLDALAALRLLDKEVDAYSLPATVAGALGQSGPGSVLAMAQHSPTASVAGRSSRPP
jgi:hypothetical protein